MVLHAAPEATVAAFLKGKAGTYAAFDVAPGGVGLIADMRALPCRDASVDAVHASHVLEHIRDDRAAISEVFRVLRPGGIALLSVPVVAPRTVEYPAPREEEHGHVRAPGPDYFDRMRDAGFSVEVVTSTRYPAGRHQLRAYRPDGSPAIDEYVPVCRKPAH